MSSISRRFGLSPSLEEEVMVIKKQGIVSIVDSDCERTKSAAAVASMRRTLSADLSSKKWLSQHGFSPLKKIASSEQFPVSITYSSSCSSLEEEEEEEEESEPHQTQFQIWSSIQQKHNKKKELGKEKQLGQFDIWNSILSQKEQELKNLPPPYIHPLVKRSASSLNEKSLQICTESLGSETGSDGLSSYPPSETGDAEYDKEDDQEVQEETEAEKYEKEDCWPVSNHNLDASKKSSPRSFPPPLASLSRADGASLRMRPRRDSGRLVLEAFSFPSQNNFKAHRQNGRLVLTFINEPIESKGEMIEEKNEMGLFEVEMENFEDEAEREPESETEVEEEDGVNVKRGDESEKARTFATEDTPQLSSGLINVHRLALMMSKSIVLENKNPTWPKKFNEQEEVEEVANAISPLTQSLPPRPPVARMTPKPQATAAATAKLAAASYNAYEYYWKPKSVATTTAALNPIIQKPMVSNNSKSILFKNIVADEKQELQVVRGKKGDYLALLSSKGCKEPRRSLSFWEPHCIATS